MGSVFKLADVIHGPSVIAELQSTDRNGVIREMVQSLAEHGAIDREFVETVARHAIARENQGSTGFGKGVAVPHVKHECLSKLVATIGRSSHGIDFAALDRAPVFTVFMLLSPANAPELHLRAMERVFRYLKVENFRKFLRQADSHDAIMEVIREADEHQDVQ
jgi:mannitol/fructose-specific phosphotransferase system IIA component (Ntr-type)